jgi:hypothetical protein
LIDGGAFVLRVPSASTTASVFPTLRPDQIGDKAMGLSPPDSDPVIFLLVFSSNRFFSYLYSTPVPVLRSYSFLFAVMSLKFSYLNFLIFNTVEAEFYNI